MAISPYQLGKMMTNSIENSKAQKVFILKRRHNIICNMNSIHKNAIQEKVYKGY